MRYTQFLNSVQLKISPASSLLCVLLLRSSTLWQKPETRSCSTRAKWPTRRTWGGGWPVWKNLLNSTNTWRDRSLTAAGHCGGFIQFCCIPFVCNFCVNMLSNTDVYIIETLTGCVIVLQIKWIHLIKAVWCLTLLRYNIPDIAYNSCSFRKHC